jgi:hypothetical protein
VNEWYANGRAKVIHERPDAKPVAVPISGPKSREVRDTIIACVNSYKRNTPSPKQGGQSLIEVKP